MLVRPPVLTRREFLSTTAVVGGGMMLGFWLPPAAKAQSVMASPEYHEALVPEINAWLAIMAALVAITIPNGKNHSGMSE